MYKGHLIHSLLYFEFVELTLIIHSHERKALKNAILGYTLAAKHLRGLRLTTLCLASFSHLRIV